MKDLAARSEEPAKELPQTIDSVLDKRAESPGVPLASRMKTGFLYRLAIACFSSNSLRLFGSRHSVAPFSELASGFPGIIRWDYGVSRRPSPLWNVKKRASLKKFYTYLNEEGKTNDEDLQELKETIKMGMPGWLIAVGGSNPEDADPPEM